MEHGSSCSVWDWTNGERSVNPLKPCNCGLRKEQAEKRAQELTRYRPLKPLGMPEADWLRTLGIKPDEE